MVLASIVHSRRAVTVGIDLSIVERESLRDHSEEGCLGSDRNAVGCEDGFH